MTINKLNQCFIFHEEWQCKQRISWFDLTNRESYFTIQVEVFTNHILAENLSHES